MKVTYIHIPKTAGLAIKEFAERNPGTINYTHHMIYEELVAEYPDHDFIAMVRNPYDRFVSSYFFYKDIYEGRRDIREEINKYKDFNEFCKDFDNFEFKEDLQFIPQAWYLYDKNGNLPIVMLEDWENSLERKCDHYSENTTPLFSEEKKCANIYVGRFGYFLFSLRMFSSIVGSPISLDIVNRSNHRPWPFYYRNEDSVALVNRLFEDDFKAFGYDRINL